MIWTQVVSFPWSSATKVKRTLPDSFSEGQQKINELMAYGGEMCPTPPTSCLSSPVIIIIIFFLPLQPPSLSQRAIVDGSGGQTPSYFSLRPASVRRKPHYSKCERRRRFEEYKGFGLVARSVACWHNTVPIITLIVFVYYILKFNSFDPKLQSRGLSETRSAC